MSSNKVAIWGAGMQGLVVADIFRQSREFEIAGFLDDQNPESKGQPFGDSSILGGSEELERLLDSGVRHLIFAFGHNTTRLKLTNQVSEMGFDLVSAIHPNAIIASDVPVGRGSIIKAGAIIDPAVTIGENVLVGSACSVAHGCVLDDGSRLSGGADLAGSVHVKRGAWVGVGSTVKERSVIGERAIIGAGSVVLQDVPSGHVVVGVPAEYLREVYSEEI